MKQTTTEVDFSYILEAISKTKELKTLQDKLDYFYTLPLNEHYKRTFVSELEGRTREEYKRTNNTGLNCQLFDILERRQHETN